MYQTYKGLVRNGRPTISEHVSLPENAQIIITILDDFLPLKTTAKKQNEALKRLSARLDEIEDEPFDEEFDEIISRRFNIGRELDI